MKYTFLLPAYKARFFEEALGSILAQTYKDFDVIVSDDCSPEDLKSIVDKFADPRVTYRRNEKNIGAEHLVDHWNMLLGLTDAEYIIMASDDDVYDERYLEEMDKLAEKYPEANVLRPRIRKIDAEGKVIVEEPLFEPTLDVNRFLELWAEGTLQSGVPYYVFKAGQFNDKGGFPNFPYAWCSDDGAVVQSIIDGSHIAVSDKVLFSFRSSGINISDTWSDESSRGKAIAVLMFFCHFLSDARIQKDIAAKARRRLVCFVRIAFRAQEDGFRYFLRLLNCRMPDRFSRKAKRQLLWTIIKEKVGCFQ